MDKMFLVKCSSGSYDDYHCKLIFVTKSKSKAAKYCAKYNRILKKWKLHYRQYEENKLGFWWIKEEFVMKHYDRWHTLNRINRCFLEEIEVR